MNLPTILFVEDEVEWSKVVCATLVEDFEIIAVANAEAAAQCLSKRRFDAIVCDHNLPGPPQGLAFLLQAKKIYPEIPRILVTGFIDPESLANIEVEAGLSVCLVKPVHMGRLRKELFSATGRSK